MTLGSLNSCALSHWDPPARVERGFTPFIYILIDTWNKSTSPQEGGRFKVLEPENLEIKMVLIYKELDVRAKKSIRYLITRTNREGFFRVLSSTKYVTW